MRRAQLWAAAGVLAVTVAACGGGTTPTVAQLGSTTTTAATAGGSSSSGQTQLAKAEAYSHCMRSHGVPNWPDPVATPGGYGFRTTGINPHSAAFQGATQACNALVPGGWSSGRQLTAAQQQAWLTWARCIRAHGMPGFPDPTFSGSEVRVSTGASGSPQLRSAMDACRSEMPSSGGLGG